MSHDALLATLDQARKDIDAASKDAAATRNQTALGSLCLAVSRMERVQRAVVRELMRVRSVEGDDTV